MTGEEAYYKEALEMPVAYCNPFRLETIPVLEEAMAVCPESWKPNYYLGNLLYEKQPERSLEQWETAINKEPDFAIAWRNVGWYYWHIAKDYAQAKRYYLEAISRDPKSALFLEECDQVLESLGEDVAFRHELLKTHHQTAVKRYYPLAAEVITGTFTGDYDYVLDLLENCYFPTREGVANFHDIYMDAILMAGRDKVDNGEYETAIELYKKAFEYPENHQVFYVDGRQPHDAQVYVAMAEAYSKLGLEEDVRSCLEKAVATDVKKTDYRYWKALALQRLGDKEAAKALFKDLVESGKASIVKDHVNFFGAEGATGKTDEAINTMAYYSMGLGYRGLGREAKAKRCFRKAVSLKKDNLWADVMLRK